MKAKYWKPVLSGIVVKFSGEFVRHYLQGNYLFRDKSEMQNLGIPILILINQTCRKIFSEG
ncbi:MAG: hypothetical protein PHG29_07300 [Prolixibacteraceae bacterium]|nr:hypothetical protein [Prolixibacteraceae bacterium]